MTGFHEAESEENSVKINIELNYDKRQWNKNNKAELKKEQNMSRKRRWIK